MARHTLSQCCFLPLSQGMQEDHGVVEYFESLCRNQPSTNSRCGSGVDDLGFLLVPRIEILILRKYGRGKCFPQTSIV